MKKILSLIGVLLFTTCLYSANQYQKLNGQVLYTLPVDNSGYVIISTVNNSGGNGAITSVVASSTTNKAEVYQGGAWTSTPTKGTYFTTSRVTVSSAPTSANFVQIVGSDVNRRSVWLSNSSAYLVYISSWATLGISTSTTPGFDNAGHYTTNTGAIFGQTENGAAPFTIGVKQEY